MSARFDAFHLPAALGDVGAGPGDGARFRTLDVGGVTCRYPEPGAALIQESVRRLRTAGERLAERPVADIIDAVDAAARRLGDRADPLRHAAEELLPAATGYSPPMIRLILDRMTADWRAERLHRLLECELGGAGAVDGFLARSGHPTDRAAALGPRLAFHVFSGNVPGVAVTSLVRALLVKAPSFGKLAAGEPVLPVLFARALAAADAGVGDAVAITYWPGGTPEPERVLLEAADAVVVYGGEGAVASVRERLGPGTRLVVHGPKLSIGAVGDGPIEGGLEGVARRAARAVATFDQQGCVSPHAIWVEGPDTRAAELAELMAAALDELQVELPRGALSEAEASAIQQERGAAEMRAHADPRVRVWTGTGTSWTVVLEPDPALRPSCLNRFVRVHPVGDLARIPGLLATAHEHLQSVALEGAGARDDSLARTLARAGATRVTTFDRLPWPSPEAHHDGAGPLTELVRWVDREV
ncbi:MAG TPA: acyl-CoA reductase [Longimicrobiales bacterium]|nr:acyl-CoA reductase [Longimicrobiales bacterium]